MTLFEEPPPADVRRVSLVRLSALIAQAAAGVGRVAVEGEIHRPQRGKTGRLWFTLRDRAAQVNVSVPASRVARSRVVAGERVSVVGRLEWVNEWGQLQLVADEVTPVGEGAIAAAIAEARRRLAADGLLDRVRRPIPRLPNVVGVVCGHEAAVRADIESVVAVKFPGYPLRFWETAVSGPGAVDHLVAALAELDADPAVEVIILARGGGDATQLLAFSDEAVCRAVCASSTPVVAAIGHEGDRPLVDEVADLRCGTPSLAAGAVIPEREALVAELEALRSAVGTVVKHRLELATSELAALDRSSAARRGLDVAGAGLTRARDRLALLHPARELARAEARLARMDLSGPPASRLAAAHARLSSLRLQAEALSPARVLDRGYAVVRGPLGVVRDPAAVKPGDGLDIQVAGGRVAAEVTGHG